VKYCSAHSRYWFCPGTIGCSNVVNTSCDIPPPRIPYSCCRNGYVCDAVNQDACEISVEYTIHKPYPHLGKSQCFISGVNPRCSTNFPNVIGSTFDCTHDSNSDEFYPECGPISSFDSIVGLGTMFMWLNFITVCIYLTCRVKNTRNAVDHCGSTTILVTCICSMFYFLFLGIISVVYHEYVPFDVFLFNILTYVFSFYCLQLKNGL